MKIVPLLIFLVIAYFALGAIGEILLWILDVALDNLFIPLLGLGIVLWIVGKR